jgi:hypothetical protein
MKIIITENKIESGILKYLNTHYNVDEIHWNPFHDDDGNPTDDAIEYYIGDYFEDDNGPFTLYKESYWVNDDDPKKELSPLLIIEEKSFYQSLNSMFGPYWEPVFKKWFEDNFGEKIKTIRHNR